MAVRIECLACNTVMNVADELLGKMVKCKCCGGIVSVAASAPTGAVAFAERPLAPPLPPTRRRVVDDDDGPTPRRRRREEADTNLLPLWIAGGGVLALLVVIVVVLLMRSGPTPAQPNINNNNVVAQDQPQPPDGIAPAANVVEEKRNAPPLIPDPKDGESLKPEQIYQRLLQSTVWIVAEHKIVAQNKNQPFAQIGPPPGIPRPPNFPHPKIGPPNFPNRPGFGPNMPPFGPNVPGNEPLLPGLNPGQNLLPPVGQKSDLQGTSWTGSETLPGFGKLTFQFISNTGVVMIDARDTSRGSYAHTGNQVTLTFGGGVIYNGTINGKTMSGNAGNGQTNWTWTVSRAGSGAAPVNPGPGGGIVAKATGSGSLIDRKHRLIITNVHVVGTADNVDIYFPDFDNQGELVVRSDLYKQKRGLKGRVVLREDRADLALVQIDQLPEGVQPLALAKSKAKPAQQVHSVGNPGASKGLWIYSPGKVRQVFPDEWKIVDDLDGKTHSYNAMKLVTDSAINPGDSGGPLVDERCALVGVAHGGSLVANNISIFIEASEVRQILEKYYRSVNDKLTQRADPESLQIATASR